MSLTHEQREEIVTEVKKSGFSGEKALDYAWRLTQSMRENGELYNGEKVSWLRNNGGDSQ